MKKIVIGILAHVDAGKTTLSEGLLYESGSIRKMGRVDNKDAFLDTFELEKERGITIFSKQAQILLEHTSLTLLDTPGHVDFSAEMERTLQVLDYALLVISGAEPIAGHTLTLWNLLRKYQIPVFLFINKMDQTVTNQQAIFRQLKAKLDSNCVDFGERHAQEGKFYEDIALCDDKVLDYFLEKGDIPKENIRKLITDRKVYPCFFGSALKLDGVKDLLEGFDEYTLNPEYGTDFGARVFKITRDEKGNRLTYMKITGGVLRVRTPISIPDDSSQSSVSQEKVSQIRIYSGEKFETVNEAGPGTVCAVTGLHMTYAGQGLGTENSSVLPLLLPAFNYTIELPPGYDAVAFLPKLRQLEEEEPQLHVLWMEDLREIRIQVMGEVQIEILKSLILKRFGIEANFSAGEIIYKETIQSVAEGIGHFEPLRHYAEVHLILEPGEPGSGLQFFDTCSDDVLGKNWRHLILTHLEEKEHRGVLTGSPITDMKITLAAGRAHQKHTEGGDFRQATYRALRQGLKQAKSVLLEPFYEFCLEIPQSAVGRAMSDLEMMHADFEIKQSEDEMTMIKGSAPVICMRDYQKSVTVYTKGFGRLSCTMKGYEPCHNEKEVVEKKAYDSEADMDNPTGSVFCSHGSGFTVRWDRVKDYMHLPAVLEMTGKEPEGKTASVSQRLKPVELEEWIDEEEVEAILLQAHYANRKEKKMQKGRNAAYTISAPRSEPSGGTEFYRHEAKEEYMLVDGYNIIFAWQELKELALMNMDAARGSLLDVLSNYQGIKQCHLIVVFDAYRVKDHDTEMIEYHNIHVVFTKEAETADQYIEKFAYQNADKYRVTVATSDGLEQIIIRGKGCRLLSARELKEDVKLVNEKIRSEYLDRQPKGKNTFFPSGSKEIIEQQLSSKSQHSHRYQ